ncbi:MAG: hypothetical protein HKM04_08145 [Legionellales bacterium]|nr:hypothetical protein [Legionellales bacterium]
MKFLQSNTFKKRLSDFERLFSTVSQVQPHFNIGLAPMYGVGTPSLWRRHVDFCSRLYSLWL